jgi:hypothetical protein
VNVNDYVDTLFLTACQWSVIACQGEIAIVRLCEA